MKYIFSLVFVLFTIHANAIQNIDQNFFDSNNTLSNEFYEQEDTQSEYRSTPPVNPPDPVPINDYLPLLAVAAVGLGFYYRKELNQTIKSN